MIGLQLIETYSLLIGKRAAFCFFKAALSRIGYLRT